MKKNKTCRTWSGAFSDHVLFPTLGKDNCIFYARALSTGTKHFSLWFLPRTFPLRKWDKSCMFSRAFYQLHIGAWHWGCMCSFVFPRLTRCMFFCAQQQLHVFPQPRYELERTLGTRLIPPLRMTCKITFNYLFADGHAMPDTIVSVIARPS